MIRHLKRRFIITATLCAAVVILVLGIGINMLNWRQVNDSLKGMMNFLLHNEGQFPISDQIGRPAETSREPFPHPPAGMESPEARFRTRFAMAKTDGQGSILWKNSDNLVSLDQEELTQLISTIVNQTGNQAGAGRKGIYLYQVEPREDGALIVVLDASQQLDTCVTLLKVTLCISAVCILLVGVIAAFCAPRAIWPIVESQQRQKQFVTNASHELKTPVAIIQANVEALELTGGESQWTQNIKFQSGRLIQLVRNLTLLARLDEEGRPVQFQDLELSALVQDMTEGFAQVMQGKELAYQVQIQPDLWVRGNREELQTMLSVLLDNAAKYALPDSTVRVQLREEDGRVLLTVSNGAVPLDATRLNRLFERFYRPDTSRTRQAGGAGVGLSIAKAITQSHGGTIQVEQEASIITFRVSLKKLSNKHRPELET